MIVNENIDPAVVSLLRDMEQPTDLIGRKCKAINPVPQTEGILTIVAAQKVWGFNEKHEYTVVDGVRVTSEIIGKTALGSTPMPLNEIEFVD